MLLKLQKCGFVDVAELNLWVLLNIDKTPDTPWCQLYMIEAYTKLQFFKKGKSVVETSDESLYLSGENWRRQHGVAEWKCTGPVKGIVARNYSVRTTVYRL